MGDRLRRTLRWSALAGALWLVGCVDEGETHFPTPVGSDSGVIPRVIPDVAVRSDAGVDAPASMNGDGGVVDAPAQVMISIVIENPTMGALVAARARFQPSVAVTVDAEEPAGQNSIASVNATLTSVTRKMQVGTLMLGKTKIESLPESKALVYRFGETPLDISMLESGEYEITVTARTSGGFEQQAKLTFVVDAGPVITVLEPAEGKPYRLSTDVDVLISDKLFGPVTDVTFTIGQTPLTDIRPIAPGSDRYKGNIDFMKYSPPLEGDLLLTVRAKNTKGTESVLLRKFMADRTGPSITNTSPATGQLIGRVITIEAKVSDPSGVIPASVIAVIGHGDQKFERKLDPPPAGAQEPFYRALFDTTVLPKNALFPSVSFRASDELGNESSVGYLVSLDNTPPLTDLDPPDDFRGLGRLDDSAQIRCSWPFDPVGPDAVDDGATVAQLFDVRARIEDQGNSPLSGDVDYTPIAGVPQGRATLLVLDDVRQPLVVDSDNDGKCDRLNPLLTPTTTPMSATDALAVDMVPIPPTGVLDGTFEPGSFCSGSMAKAPDPYCSTVHADHKARWPRLSPSAGAYPFLPHGESGQFVMSYGTAKTAAIWTIPPVVNDGVQCGGRQFDAFANHVSDGWACLAVAATDGLGNHQVSRVIRVCIDNDGNGAECGQHRRIARTTFASTVVVETTADHGIADGAEVIVGGVADQTAANGRWTVQKLDDRRLSLVGSMPYRPWLCRMPGVDGCVQVTSLGDGAPGVIVETAAPHGALTGQTVLLNGSVYDGGLNNQWEVTVIDATRVRLNDATFSPPTPSGWLIGGADLPNCTGTLTQLLPKPEVDGTKPCTPWRLYPRNETRRF
jgi:hypothetical protein